MELSTLLSGAGGGLVGFLGPIVSKAIGIWEARERRKDRAMEMEQEQKRWSHETDLLELQMKAKAEETEQAIAIKDTEGSWQALGASYAAEAAIGQSYRWVDAARALTRPALTLMLWVIVAMAWFGATLEQQQVLIDTIVFSATAATLWWFGTRDNRTTRRDPS